MPKVLIEVACPCCQATLKIDPQLAVVISHKVHEKPAPIEDLAAEVAKLKGASGRREELFQKHVAAEKSNATVLNRKFDELLKQAKSDPNKGKPIRDFDLD